MMRSTQTDRLSPAEALRLLEEGDLLELAEAAAGCVHRASPERLARLIRAAGFQPRRRDCYYGIAGV